MKKQRDQQETYAVIPVPSEMASPISGMKAHSRTYDDHLKRAGQIADRFARSDTFAEAQSSWTENTRRRYLNDLKPFSAARDALLMGLLVEHALRCSEVALLTIDSINLRRGTIKIYRPKTDRIDIQKLHTHTRLAAQAYLSQIQREHGPLFTGYDPEKSLSTRAINKRVGC